MKETAKTIAILGANGRLSNMAAKAFCKAGYDVIAISRNGNIQNLATDIRQKAADAMDEKALVEATEGADFIFNGLNPIYTKWKEAALPMARNVLAAAKAHNAIHLFPGNVYNYGKEISLGMEPDDASSPSVAKGEIRIRMEDLYEKAAYNDGVKTIILRAGDFFGGSVEGAWFDLVLTTKLKKGVLSYPGPMNLPHAWAYLPDLAQTFVALAGESHSFSNFERFNFEGHTLTGNQILATLSKILNVPLKRGSVPWPIIRVGGIFNGMMREVSEMSYLWFTAHSLNQSKLDNAVGIVPKTTTEIAFSTALQDLDMLNEIRKSA